jgi:hypothetical protein
MNGTSRERREWVEQMFLSVKIMDKLYGQFCVSDHKADEGGLDGALCCVCRCCAAAALLVQG